VKESRLGGVGGEVEMYGGSSSLQRVAPGRSRGVSDWRFGHVATGKIVNTGVPWKLVKRKHPSECMCQVFTVTSIDEPAT
jgi:hypothetical protein